MSETSERSNCADNKVVKDNIASTKKENRPVGKPIQRRAAYRVSPKLKKHIEQSPLKANSTPKEDVIPVSIGERNQTGIVVAKAIRGVAESKLSDGYMPICVSPVTVDANDINKLRKKATLKPTPRDEVSSSETILRKKTDIKSEQNCLPENSIRFFETITTKKTSNPQGIILDYEIRDEYFNNNNK